MKEEELHNELASIRNIMERSSKFISLSGLSGILAGVYALIGATVAWFVIKDHPTAFVHTPPGTFDFEIFFNLIAVVEYLIMIAIAVLLASIITGVILSIRKAKQKGESVWNKTSRLLLLNVAVPLLTGFAVIIMLFFKSDLTYTVSTMLVFYGLALFNASNFTYTDVKYLGIIDILLGLATAFFPEYSLWAWAIGFGVLHIIYGSIMYLKYDR
jgi:predicted lysophospholipase L1 biosynthesis ABC-type transport system permease subunit